MKDTYTWANLSMNIASQEKDIELAIRATSMSTHPSRVTILTNARTQIPETEEARTHILANIPKGTIEVAKHTLEGRQTNKNQADLILVLVENTMAPEADYKAIRRDLNTISPLIQTHTPAWTKSEGTPAGPLPESTIRKPKHLWPQLTWYRDEPSIKKGKLVEQTRAHTLLSIMGIGPKI